MSPLDPLNEIGYMPPPSNLEDQIQLTPTIFGAPEKDNQFLILKSTVFPMSYSTFQSDNGIIYITPCKMRFCLVNTAFSAC